MGIINETIKNPLFGNSIGLISLIVGIISFVITCFTYHKTRLVKEKMDKIAQTASSRTRLSVYKKSFLETLQENSQIIEKNNRITNSNILSLAKVTRNLLDYSDCLKYTNKQIICEAHKYIISYTSYEDELEIRTLGDYITRIINILENGDEVL